LNIIAMENGPFMDGLATFSYILLFYLFTIGIFHSYVR
jgi:hypothetical protein